MPGGRSPLFGKIIRTIRRADWLEKNPDQRSFFFDALEASRVSRRDFVRMLAGAGIVIAAGKISARTLDKHATPPRWIGPNRASEPVAILGGGLAGLTAAYRLNQAGVPCEIFEASRRTGGRVLTKYDFNRDHMFCELGGELVDSDHEDLISLASEFGLEIQELKLPDDGSDLYFFGGKHYTEADVIPLFKPFATRVAADIDQIYDSEKKLTDQAVPFDRMSVAEYLAKRSDGVEKWVIEMLRVAYVIENGREAEEQSSLNFLCAVGTDTNNGFKVYGESDESKRIKGGNSRLPNALRRALEGRVKINLGDELVKISDTGTNIVLDFDTDHGTATHKFRQVICALPFSTLRRVDGLKALPLGKMKQRAIAELGYGDNRKVMYGLTERWWREISPPLLARSNGSTFTDLSLQCTWDTSRGQDGKRGILTNFLGGTKSNQFDVSRIGKLSADWDRLFPGIRAKVDGRHATMHWPEQKFTRGSYSCPLVGQYTDLLPVAGKPELDGRLLFAGEHTSEDFFGFMNGAIKSGNRVAREVIAGSAKKLSSVGGGVAPVRLSTF